MSMTPEDILTFWFEETPRENHFKKDVEFDAVVEARFGHLIDELAGQIKSEGATGWEGTPEGDLASIIVLDQFPRNIHRGSAQSFAYDAMAVALVHRAMERKAHERLEETRRAFIFMPLMHAEDLEAQELCVKCFRELFEDQSNLPWAIDHRDIIKRFGRFPHRNAVLGRESTPAEVAFLDEGGFAG